MLGRFRARLISHVRSAVISAMIENTNITTTPATELTINTT
jgi:hypothetical protein